MMAGRICHIQPIMKWPVSIECCQDQYPTTARRKYQIGDPGAGGSRDHSRAGKQFYLLQHGKNFRHNDLESPCTENLFHFILVDETAG
jgi:hypothetical protein